MKCLFKTKKWVKWTILMICILGGIGLGACAIKEGIGGNVSTEEKVKYSYSNKEDVSYAVNLNSTKVYDEKTLEEGTYYLSKYIKDILITFKESFTASEETAISGKYKVVATLRGYTTEQEQKVTIWSKDYEMVPETSLDANTMKQEFKTPVTVNLKPYTDFLAELRDVDQINTSSELIVAMTGEKVIQTPNGEVKLPIMSTVTIPTDQGYFKIEKSTSEPKEEEQKESITVALPANVKYIVIYAVGAVICLIMAAIAWCGIGEVPAQDKKTKRNNHIFVEYGSRMIGINEIRKEDFKYIYRLSSIEDMIKLSDEIERPIMYIKGATGELVNEFYIQDGVNLYSYEIAQETTEHSGNNESTSIA